MESGTAQLQNLLNGLAQHPAMARPASCRAGSAFDLYATYGLPFEITRDIAREQDLDVDEAGFRAAMDEHRIASGGGKAMGKMGGEDAEFFAGILKDLQRKGRLDERGVEYDPVYQHARGRRSAGPDRERAGGGVRLRLAIRLR